MSQHVFDYVYKFTPKPAFAFSSGVYFYPASTPTIPVIVKSGQKRKKIGHCFKLVRCVV